VPIFGSQEENKNSGKRLCKKHRAMGSNQKKILSRGYLKIRFLLKESEFIF
jgi:hypothetical protein